jgi:hypothetical protein
LTVRGRPFGGYVPDVDPALLSLAHAEACTGLIDRGGKLVPAPGFFRVDNSTAELPLGGPSLTGNPNLTFADADPDTITRAAGSFVTDGFTAGDSIVVSGTVSNDGTYTIDTGGVAASVLTLIATDTLSAEGPTNDHLLYKAFPASTADAESIVGLIQFVPTNTVTPTQLAVTAVGNGSVGHLWSFSGGAWSKVFYDGADSNEITGTAADLVDWAFFPWLDAESDVTGGQIVFSNDKSGDSVYFYPNASSEYSDLPHSIGSTTSARSICRYTERIILFNTVEGGTRYPQQVRFGPVAGVDFTASGSGTIQVSGTDGKGVKCLPIGSYVALYLEDGVAFMRGTGVPTAPFEIDYVSKERGLLPMDGSSSTVQEDGPRRE